MIKWVPAGVIAAIVVLAIAGSQFRAYDVSDQVRCNYVLAEQTLPAADVLLIGASRVRRGLDPDYIEELLATAEAPASVDRLSLNFPNFTQYYPLIKRYLERRGASKIAYLQLAYNFKPERQKVQDLPLNSQRNLAFGHWSDLVDVQWDAPLNDTGTVLPRQLHAKWRSLPASWFARVELNVYSGLRYFPKQLTGQMPECSGAFLRANGLKSSANQMTIERAQTVLFEAPDPELLDQWRAEAANFLPLAPGAQWRQGETAQLQRLIDMLQAAGTQVVFLIMPAIGERTVNDETRQSLNEVFPGIDVFFPMDAYDGLLADQLAVSFVDTHHANDFGAIYFSKALAKDLEQRLGAQ